MENKRKPTGHYDKNGRMIFAGDDIAVDIHPTAHSKEVVSTMMARVFWGEPDKRWLLGFDDRTYPLNEHPSCDMQVV